MIQRQQQQTANKTNEFNFILSGPDVPCHTLSRFSFCDERDKICFSFSSFLYSNSFSLYSLLVLLIPSLNQRPYTSALIKYIKCTHNFWLSFFSTDKELIKNMRVFIMVQRKLLDSAPPYYFDANTKNNE